MELITAEVCSNC